MGTTEDLINSFASGKLPTNNSDLSDAIDKIYYQTAKDWYKTYPYVFSIVNTDYTPENSNPKDPPNYHYALPIPPESLTTQMVAPTDAVPTLGGVIEEPSAAVFWNIQLAGTTGVGVGRQLDAMDTNPTVSEPASLFRDVIPKTGLATSIMLSGSRLASYASGAISIGSAPLADLAETASRTAQYLIQPHLPYSYSAVSDSNNGFTEIHRLHKFFIFYTHLNCRRDTSSNVDVDKFKKKNYALYFINYKDNQKFRIVLKNFSMTKVVGQPFLYKYQIQLKGWNLSDITMLNRGNTATDRFKGDLASVSTITLTSAITKAKNVMRAFNSAKTDPMGTFLSIPPVV